ncbi:MAG: HDOD domain-containing protein [Verrucomicrobiota bacterium]|nr:HDOD domain-containing protein [Verrucomicrobiota bacterium]
MAIPTTIPTLQSVCDKAASLPCSPVLIPRLSKTLADLNSSADDIVGIIRMDTGLASGLLRLANSAYYGGGQVDTLEDAVMRLGAREIFKMANSMLAVRWFTQPIEGYGWEVGDYCRFSLMLAIASEQLAIKSRLVEPEQAYTAGLMQDIGKLAVAYSCLPWFPDIRAHQTATGIPWAAAETAILGFNHADTGTRLLSAWHFPDALIQTVTFSHHPASAPEAVQPLLAVLHAGRVLATSIGSGVCEDGFLVAIDEAFLARYNLKDFGFDEILIATVEKMEKLLGSSAMHGKITMSGMH